LRSRRLLQACLETDFIAHHPEDIAIGRTNRMALESKFGCVFPDPGTAARFSFERSAPAGRTFGFHGVFNMVRILGPEAFVSLYQTLDERTPVWRDFWSLLGQLREAQGGWKRQLRFAHDRLRSLLWP
jgi:hypothetical protein